MVKPDKKTIRLKNASSESLILSAARAEFIDHGLRGARMQAIADRGRVNKALLHYYFRSKEKLYEAVLQDMMHTLLGAVRQQLPHEGGKDDLRSLLRLVVTTYIKTLQQNPDFPRFILREIVEGGAHLPIMVNELISSFGDIPLRIQRLLVAQRTLGGIRKVDPVHIALNILGMCIFTFIARPIVGAVNERLDLGIRFDDGFFNQRIEAILDMAFNGLFKEH
ncbi:MAG: helix-turn-helix transcriptional regulator [Chitinispirillaceae bacterium]|nr:helix-turn-helix transcriptional regulator [Chitinispirillaceae bacterium]